uniref:Uncharacterized protein n=1 Tax=viral metagenome TaxID=1070528 RepID=A0A6M3L3M5_9ZZZZ
MVTKIKEAMSDNDRRTILQQAVTDSLAVGNTMDGPYIRDIYDTELVYEVKGKVFRIAYVIDRKGKVVLGQAERVTPQTVYNPVIESVESKIEQLTTLQSEREDNNEVRESLDNLLNLLEKEDVAEETAGPLLKQADKVILKLTEAPMMKTEDGEQYPASAFAYVPEPDKPSTWKLRLWEDPTKKITRAQLGRAASALSPGGFRGQKADIPSADLPAVKRKIRAQYKKLEVADEEISKWVKEANEARERIFESCEVDIQEVTKEGIAKGILPVRIIQPGFNSSKGRFYSEQAIKDAAVIFDNHKMYADHPTKEDERQRPERSIRDWVATLHATRVSDAGNAVGEAHINAGWLKEKIQTLYEQGDLQHLGTSINAIGRGTKQLIEGIKTTFVEGLVNSRTQSVDFVTEAGAGGQAGLRESIGDSFVDADLIDVATLRESRPDLVEAIESDIRNQINMEVKKKMELEERVKELEGQVTTLTTENGELKETITQAEKEKVRAEAQAVIKEAVSKAELPEVAKTRLLKAHEKDETSEAIEEAIKEEVAYVATLTETGKIRNLGPTHDPDPKTEEKLAEGFRALGLSEEASKTAAKGR